MRGPPSVAGVSDLLGDLVRAVGELPVLLRNGYLDVVVANDLAQRLTAAFTPGTNIARSAFLDPGASRATTPWEATARDVAGLLRERSAEHLDDPRFRGLVGELAARSDDFNRAWQAGVPPRPGTGSFAVEHPVVGRLALTWVDLLAPAQPPGLTLTVVRPDDATTAQRLQSLRTRP
ncbi:hypothetical protein GCM10009528_35210 [Kineococcus aurantiacus]